MYPGNWQGPHRVYNGGNEGHDTTWRLVPGQGHFGADAVPGVCTYTVYFTLTRMQPLLLLNPYK